MSNQDATTYGDLIVSLLTVGDSPSLTKRSLMVASELAQSLLPGEALSVRHMTEAYKRGALEERKRLMHHMGIREDESLCGARNDDSPFAHGARCDRDKDHNGMHVHQHSDGSGCSWDTLAVRVTPPAP